MKRANVWMGLLFGLLFGCVVGIESAQAQDTTRKDGQFVIRDFRFQSGETLPELRLNYITLGAPKRDAGGQVTNAVLVLHGTTSSGKAVVNNFSADLFAAGQPLDSREYYIILPDSIGHGGSSKPSNGLGTRFPRYGYNDMVRAQHRLVTEGLGVNRLRLVIGGSMGGMHTWLWGVEYPEMMDALMPLTSEPAQVSGMNYLWRRVMIEAIRTDPDWNGGLYEKQPTHWYSAATLLFGMADSSVRLQKIAPTNDKSRELYENLLGRARKAFPDANDFLYAFEASWDYDPAPQIARIKARLLALNFTDDLINPSEAGAVEAAVARIPNARSVLVPPGSTSFGHFNQNHPKIWKQHVAELLKSLP
jgi:homoserine O-acetyltransferase/O-succinyltransferase